MSPLPSSSSSTMTEPKRDVESQKPHDKLSLIQRQFDPSGVTTEVVEWDYRGSGTHEDPYIVDFLPQDAMNPMLFSKLRKWFIVILQAISVLAVTFVSTAYSGGIIYIIREFAVSQIVAILGVSLFVAGFALGPIIWAPLSELYGRQPLFFFTYMALTVFNAAAAASPNMHSLIIFRFLAGTFGSSPLTNSGGVIADMFNAQERGLATALFATAPFLGPSIGPIVAGFLGEAAGWRWIEGLMAAFTGLLWILCSLLVPETYAPALLRRRAEKLSKVTGKVYTSKFDAGRPKNMAKELKVALSRPWILLFSEPIVFLTALYMAIIYGILYMCFAAFPIVFQLHRGWSPSIGGLSFLGITVGMVFAIGYTIFDNMRYQRVAKANGGSAPPEERLPPALLGSVLLPIGLFWFAWTNGPEIHWIVSIIGTAIFGAGLVLVFLSLMNYLIDAYLIYAASALAANAIVRSLFGAAFPLFTTQMYNAVGIHWGSSIPAFLALACVPFPFLFWKYGYSIRMKCKFSAEAAAFLAKMQGKTEEPKAETTEPAVK